GAALPVPGPARRHRGRRLLSARAPRARDRFRTGVGLPVVARGRFRRADPVRRALHAPPRLAGRRTDARAGRGRGLRRIPLRDRCRDRGGARRARRAARTARAAAAGAVGRVMRRTPLLLLVAATAILVFVTT